MHRVLVTRHQPEAEKTASRLRDMGFLPLVSPARQVITLDVPTIDEEVDGVIVTSRNALHDRLELPAALLRKPAFCVGERSAGVARAFGFREAITGEGNAAGLVAAIRQAMPEGGRLLYLAGKSRRPTIEGALMAAGFELVVRMSYRIERAIELTSEAQSKLRAGEISAALHFSVESAGDLFALLRSAGLGEPARDLRHFCLSAAVAEAVRASGVSPDRIVVAERPDQASLLSLLRTHLTT